MNDSVVAAGTIVRLQTMADGTWRVVVDLHDQAEAQGIIAAGNNAQVAIALLKNSPRLEAESSGNEETEPSAQYAEYAQKLFRRGFFNNPKLWPAVGLPQKYYAWLRRQPCSVHGKRGCPPENYDMQTGEPRIEVVHVPVTALDVGVDDRGTGIKKSWGAIPMCHTFHMKQHNQGHLAVMSEDEWIKASVKHCSTWAAEALKAQLGYEHWYDVPPEKLRAWAIEHDLAAGLPGG